MDPVRIGPNRGTLVRTNTGLRSGEVRGYSPLSGGSAEHPHAEVVDLAGELMPPTDHESIPNLETIDTPDQLAAALTALRRARGLSYGELDKKVRPERLPSTTISDMCAKGRPTRETLELFLRACDVPKAEREAWQQARQRALTQHPPAAGAVRVNKAIARRLGVHAAIEVEGATGALSLYVERDIDTAPSGVRHQIRQAMDRGGLVVLVGESSVGKTRCAFEAIQALMPAWWLIHPADAAALQALTTQPVTHTVVWLDELQTYLAGERGLTAALVRSLLDAGAVLVATLWPERYSTYITRPPADGPDLYPIEREVLKLAEIVRIASELSPAEHERARQAAVTDRRIAVALESTDYGMTQVIAAAPQLLSRWCDAGPYAKAIMTAAIDAARLGAQAPLSAELLRAAAPGYCTPRQKAAVSSNWFETGLAYATETLHGAAAALTPVAAQMGQITGYIVADYLLQHASAERRMAKVPAVTWQALIDYLIDPGDQARVGANAYYRLLYRYAEPLLHRASDAGNWSAADRLVELLARQGRVEEAIAVLQGQADTGGGIASDWLAGQGRAEQLRAWANARDEYAADWLAELLAGQGQVEEAITVLHRAVDAGNGPAAYRLVHLLAGQSQVEKLRVQADTGNEYAADWLAELLAGQGQVEELRVRAGAGDRSATRRLVHLLAGQGQL
ncbi:helix-turn-helix domain-containing protein, partial [Planobispora siamensis]